MQSVSGTPMQVSPPVTPMLIRWTQRQTPPRTALRTRLHHLPTWGSARGRAVSGLCGNGQIDPGENCDGTVMNNATCSGLGYSSGNLACSSTCQFDVSACTGGTITPTVVASRTSCPAPCGVFFDATTTSGLSASNYWRANWSWDFNDPTNAADLGTIGFVAAHIFDKPGTYHVVARVHDLAGNAGSTTTTITVTALSGTTYYVASSGNDSNNGTSMSTPWHTPAKAVSSGYAANNTSCFVGAAFSLNATAGGFMSTDGPFLWGAYTDPGSPSSSDQSSRSAIPITAFSVLGTTSVSSTCTWWPRRGTRGCVVRGRGNRRADRVRRNAERRERDKRSHQHSPGRRGDDQRVRGPTTACTTSTATASTQATAYSAASDIAIFGNTLLNFAGTTGQPLHGIRLSACTNGLGNCTGGGFYLAKNTITVGPTVISSRHLPSTATYKTPSSCTTPLTTRAGSVPPTRRSWKTEHGVVRGQRVGLAGLRRRQRGHRHRRPKVEVRNNLILNADTGIAIRAEFSISCRRTSSTKCSLRTTPNIRTRQRAKRCSMRCSWLHIRTRRARRRFSTTSSGGMMNSSSGVVGFDGMGTESIDYTDIYSPNATLTAPSVGPHGIVADPMFVSAPTSSSDPITVSGFELQATSPAINAGTNSDAYEDLYRVTRPQQTGWDMGAFEHVP